MRLKVRILQVFIILFIASCKNNNDKDVTVKNIKDNLIGDYTAKIDSIIQITSPRRFNGVILITKNGETLYSKTYGYSNFKEKTPIKLTDNFRIQSNSKQVTAVLVLKEVEKGNIDLHKSIKTYLPEFNQTWADTVTVHQLLNMSSGIVALDKPLIFESGKGYKYSNPAYGILGRIIENTTQKTYIELANNLFQELQMTNTYCFKIGKDNVNPINGYDLKNNIVNRVEFDSLGFAENEWKDFIPAGGIISNVYDLNIWDTKLHNSEILNSKYYNLMVTPTNQGAHAAFNNDVIGYGYGLRLHNLHSTIHLGHGGRGLGFVSLKFYIPEQDVDVIIWENVYYRDANVMSSDIVYYFENEIRKIVLHSNLVK